LDDLVQLTPIQRTVAPPVSPATSSELYEDLRGARVGERDSKFWPYIALQAQQATSLEALIEVAREMNEMIREPLADSEVVAKCTYWWRKTLRGENRFGIGKFLLVEHARIDDLMMRDPDAFLLQTFLKRQHWNREFSLANDTCGSMPGGGWRRQRFTAARSRLIKAGLLIVVRPASFKPNRPMFCKLASYTTSH
jgi:hypothetical protein